MNYKRRVRFGHLPLLVRMLRLSRHCLVVVLLDQNASRSYVESLNIELRFILKIFAITPPLRALIK